MPSAGDAKREGADVCWQVSSQRVAKAFGFSHVVDDHIKDCPVRQACPSQQGLGGKLRTHLLAQGLRWTGGRCGLGGVAGSKALAPVPNGDRSTTPAARDGLDRAQ